MVSPNLFVYGSLMSLQELNEMFGTESYKYCTVKLQDFVRDFSHVAWSWDVSGEEAGVLGIREQDCEWCNGLLISDITTTQVDAYCLRETGFTFAETSEHDTKYRIDTIPSEKFTPYENQQLPDGPIYAAICESRKERLETPNEYKQLAYTAAYSHGDRFFEDFIQTTYDTFVE